MSEQMSRLISILPFKDYLCCEDFLYLEEIRLSLGKKIRLISCMGEREILCYANEELIRELLDRSTGRSYHCIMEMIRQGYLVLPGGHRLGICGTGVYIDGQLRNLRDISSVNIRVARSVPGFGRRVADELRNAPGSALCMGPPGRGKTTLLRDVIRQLSIVYHQRIAVIDERRELAATIDGCPQFDLGPTTDIMSSVKKAEALDMLIRTMGPTWIALDEITREEDVDAMIRGSYCGVKYLATAHGNGLKDMMARPIYKKLLDHKVFDYLYYIDPNRAIRKEALNLCSVS